MNTAPQRVLHIVSAMNRGGAETLLMNLYRHIDRSKVQFDFISHRFEQGDYDKEIESLGGTIYHIPSLGHGGPFKYISSIINILKSRQYIAIHSHTDYQSGFPALAAKFYGIERIICHSHSNQWNIKETSMKNKVVFKLLQGLIRFSATTYCACSEEAACFLFGEKEVRRGNITILKNGVDTMQFLQNDDEEKVRLKQALDIPLDAKIIGHVGNFSAIKNQRFIIPLLKSILEDGYDCYLIFAGDGELRAEVENEANRLGVKQNIRFLGVRDDIENLMTSFDVFVFPSLKEGFGLVTLEAQCAGTPCVVSDTVPKTTDMGLGIIDYINLEDNLSCWTEHIKKAFQTKAPDKEAIFHSFTQNGFDIRESSYNWLKLYGIS